MGLGGCGTAAADEPSVSGPVVSKVTMHVVKSSLGSIGKTVILQRCPRALVAEVRFLEIRSWRGEESSMLVGAGA